MLPQAPNERGESGVRGKHGAERSIKFSAAPISDALDEYLGAVATFADNAESRALAIEAQQMARELHDLYDNAPCGYHSLYATGLIVRINDTELGWLGSARDEA